MTLGLILFTIGALAGLIGAIICIASFFGDFAIRRFAIGMIVMVVGGAMSIVGLALGAFAVVQRLPPG